MIYKTALGVLSGLVALPVVLAWAVPPLLDGDSLSPLLQDELSTLLGHPVRIGGDTVVRLLPSPSLTAHRLDIFDPGSEHQATPSATVGWARVDVPLLPLLRGQLDVSTLQLDNLSLQGVPTVTHLTAQRGVTGDVQGKLDISGLSLDFTARFTPGNQITLTDAYGAVLTFNGSISEHGVELAGPVDLTMPEPHRSLARFGGFLPTQPLKISAQITVDQGQVEITNLAGLLGDAAIVGALELTAGHDLTVRMTTNGLDMDRWVLVVPQNTPSATGPAGGPHLEARMPWPVLPRVQMALVSESFTLGGLVWPAARLLLETTDAQVALKLAEVDVPGGRIQLSGQGSLTGETYFDGTLSLSTRDRQIFGAWLGLDPVDFSMTVPINWVRQGVNLTPITGQWNATPLYGGLTLVPQDAAQTLVMDIKTAHGDFGLQSQISLANDGILNLNDFMVQIGRYSAQGSVQAGWEDGKPRFAALLNTPPASASAVAGKTGGVESSGIASAFTGGGTGDGVAALIQVFAAATEIPIGNSTIDWQGPDLPLGPGIILSQPRARLLWQKDRVSLDSLTGRWGEGAVALKGSVIRDPQVQDGVRLDAYGRVSDADIAALGVVLGPVSLASGKFEVEGNISTYGRTASHWLKGLEGMIRFDAGAGHLRGINLPALVVAVKTSGVAGLLRVSRKTLLSGVTPFQSLTGTAVLDGPQLSTDDLVLTTESGIVSLASSINLRQKTGDSTITLKLTGLEPLQFDVDGPLDHPKVTSDPNLLKKKTIQ